MSIDYYLDKIKPYTWIITIILSAFIILGLWQLHALNLAKTPIKIINMSAGGQSLVVGQSQTVIASKTGTKYYLPWCGALKRIKPENRVSFATPALARTSGYTPASNCKGVK